MSETRLQIFTLIEQNPGISTKELAIKMGVSRQLMNLHVKVLKESVPPYIKSKKEGLVTKYYINIENNEKT